MLTRLQLAALHRSLRNEPVLTVYVDGATTDPATRHAWRVDLDHRLNDLRLWLTDATHAERAGLERSIQLLEEELATLSGGVAAPGWVAFIEPGRFHEAHHLPAPTPTLAVWSMGLCIAPYMRALKQTRPVVVAVADARKVDLYYYCVGKLERIATVRAHRVVGPSSHMGAPSMQGFHTGTRGSAGHDAAQRALLAGRDRMVAEAADRIRDLAADDSWIVLGGIPRVVARLASELSAVSRHRILELEALDVHASAAHIAAAAQHGASTLRDASDARQLANIAELAESGGAAAVGPAATEHALEQACVRDLYLTRRYLNDHAAEAEDAVRAAFDQDAVVEEVSRAPAEWLDARGGMAARLRYGVGEAETADAGIATLSAP